MLNLVFCINLHKTAKAQRRAENAKRHRKKQNAENVEIQIGAENAKKTTKQRKNAEAFRKL